MEGGWVYLYPDGRSIVAGQITPDLQCKSGWTIGAKVRVSTIGF